MAVRTGVESGHLETYETIEDPGAREPWIEILTILRDEDRRHFAEGTGSDPRFEGVRRGEAATYLKTLDALILASDTSPVAVASYLAALERDQKVTSTGVTRQLKVLRDVNELRARLSAMTRMAVLARHLSHNRTTSGAFPPNLRALSIDPDKLVLIDPLSGASFRYRVDDLGATILIGQSDALRLWRGLQGASEGKLEFHGLAWRVPW
jgi:hypothetical protein